MSEVSRALSASTLVSRILLPIALLVLLAPQPALPTLLPRDPAITSTTVTSSESGACENFVGACVVYGSTGDASVAYTTTVYELSSASDSSSQTPDTSTITVYLSETLTPDAPATAACGDFSGACVIYATDSQGSAISTTTAYNGGNTGEQGNSEGYIGGAAMDIDVWALLPWISLLVFNVGFAVFM